MCEFCEVAELGGYASGEVVVPEPESGEFCEIPDFGWYGFCEVVAPEPEERELCEVAESVGDTAVEAFVHQRDSRDPAVANGDAGPAGDGGVGGPVEARARAREGGLCAEKRVAVVYQPAAGGVVDSGGVLAAVVVVFGHGEGLGEAVVGLVGASGEVGDGGGAVEDVGIVGGCERDRLRGRPVRGREGQSLLVAGAAGTDVRGYVAVACEHERDHDVCAGSGGQAHGVGGGRALIDVHSLRGECDGSRRRGWRLDVARAQGNVVVLVVDAADGQEVAQAVRHATRQAVAIKPERPEVCEVAEFGGYGTREFVVDEIELFELCEVAEFGGYGTREIVLHGGEVQQARGVAELWWYGSGEIVVVEVEHVKVWEVAELCGYGSCEVVALEHDV